MRCRPEGIARDKAAKARRFTEKWTVGRPPKLRLLEGKRYLRTGFKYSDQAKATLRWQRRKQRRGDCKHPESPHWHGGVKANGDRWASPTACHLREHDGCRPSECVDRIRALNGCTLLTLTDRRKSNARRVRDWRFGSVGKRLERFLNLMRKRFGRFKYVWVRECHESGFPHIHIVLDLPFPTTEVAYEVNPEKDDEVTMVCLQSTMEAIKLMWLACGGGWSVRWEHLRQGGEYIAKYLDSQEGMDEETLALVAINKLRDWSASKGLKAPRVDLPWAVTARGTKQRATDIASLGLEEVRRELAGRREDLIRKHLEEWKGKR